MKLVKGSKVEVLQEAEVPLGSWRGAEIVLGNGQSFYVRYDPSPVDSCAAVERVQRRLIRPCPPRDDSVCWAVGDILEAFDSYSWKIAEMVRVLGKDFYLVRLLGSSLELRTHASELRLRKHWKDGKWTVLQKDSTKCFGGSFRGQPKSGNLGSNFGKQRQPYCAMDNNLLLKNQKALEGDKSRGMKRKSSAITHPTQCSEVTRGMKRLQTPHRDGRHAALVAGVSPRLAEKGRSRRLVKHPSVGPCRWRSLPHGLLYVKCGNIPSNFCWYLAHLAIRSSKSDASQGLRRFSRKTSDSPPGLGHQA
uniref:Agenet domain-containing protein n=1 Tax=Oryza glumipatula TaxID=40148 RepID=A0A0E0ABJ1_9ORYZ